MFKNAYLNYGLAIIVCVWAIIFGRHHFHNAQIAKNNLPLVATALVQLSNLSEPVQTIGTIKAIQSVDISAPVNGVVDQILFQSGQMVTKNQVLVILTNQDLKARVAEDQAKYDVAASHYQRLQKLFALKAISAADMDNDASLVKQARAQLDYDKIQLDKTILKAPFAGQVGIRQVNLGQYLSPGQAVVSMQDHSTLYVDFSLPERYVNLFKIGDQINIYPEEHKSLRYISTISALGEQIDATTRNLPVRATINNANNALIPGMFVNVQLVAKNTDTVLIIPQTAVTYNPKGAAVYVIKNKQAILKQVTIGERINDVAIVLTGLTAGEEVVVAGQLKLTDGASVSVERSKT